MKEIDCIVCGRKNAGVEGRIHEGWCWGCIKNKMEGRNYNSYGKPWKEEGEIGKLQARIKEMEEYAQEGWDLAEAYSIKIEELEQKKPKMLCNNGVHL